MFPWGKDPINLTSEEIPTTSHPELRKTLPRSSNIFIHSSILSLNVNYWFIYFRNSIKITVHPKTALICKPSWCFILFFGAQIKKFSILAPLVQISGIKVSHVFKLVAYDMKPGGTWNIWIRTNTSFSVNNGFIFSLFLLISNTRHLDLFCFYHFCSLTVSAEHLWNDIKHHRITIIQLFLQVFWSTKEEHLNNDINSGRERETRLTPPQFQALIKSHFLLNMASLRASLWLPSICLSLVCRTIRVWRAGLV